MNEKAWQPSETAPKGCDVLVFFGKFRIIRVIRQSHDGEWHDEDGAVYAMPSYWMPLPEPPK
jgi:hypothetical protein